MTTAALAGAMAAVAVIASCGKDEKGIAPNDVSVEVFKQIPDRIKDGWQGNVKQHYQVQYHYSLLKPNADTTNVELIGGGKKQQEYIREYNAAGFRTLTRQVSYEFNYGADGTEVSYKREDAYALDGKNRQTKWEYMYYQKYCISSERGDTCTGGYNVQSDTTIYTYEYNDSAKTCTRIIIRNGREESKYVYALNEDGTIDDGNYGYYPVVHSNAFAENPSQTGKTKTDKDGQGNVTRRAQITRYGDGFRYAWCSLTTSSITYY